MTNGSAAAENHGDAWLPLELAGALYAQSLTDPQRRTAYLTEAATLVSGLPPALRPLREVSAVAGIDPAGPANPAPLGE